MLNKEHEARADTDTAARRTQRGIVETKTTNRRNRSGAPTNAIEPDAQTSPEREQTTTKSMLYTCPCTEPTTANAKANGKHEPARASAAYIQYVPRRYRSAAYRILARANSRQSLAQRQEVKRKQKKTEKFKRHKEIEKPEHHNETKRDDGERNEGKHRSRRGLLQAALLEPRELEAHKRPMCVCMYVRTYA
ncbi:hypothetical protein HETIRDRAFT_386884 [Heterobasidion irregulare TC 32-1]|uniref:Uncharacterized protein n=1 Tax=Heterobasidion irregulare (strain TC 32-1) TaxID=747525 RepID=W4JYQ9_HETIT|nr:uncharacterized protein HETIRDRAFT_386884 [Heterobasidion irregulare TC 32-1]ETW78702.1 hypothetical protein HETIRDRAFT_386884 [Heterobasidion irregulare TC 32-1]